MIGIFDSGVGGLSVLNAIRDLMPEADLTYVADRSRSPYGTRSLAEVRAISLEVSSFLVEEGATTLVVACNTASAAALYEIRATNPTIEVVGMEPAVKPATELTTARTVGVFATEATFQGELFNSVVSRFATDTQVLTRACPDWVTLVESGQINGSMVEQSIKEAVMPMIDAGVDVLVLGCTHFSFLGPLIKRVSGLPVIDPAPAVARRVHSVTGYSPGTSSTLLRASGDLDQFENLVATLTTIKGQFGMYP